MQNDEICFVTKPRTRFRTVLISRNSYVETLSVLPLKRSFRWYLPFNAYKSWSLCSLHYVLVHFFLQIVQTRYNKVNYSKLDTKVILLISVRLLLLVFLCFSDEKMAPTNVSRIEVTRAFYIYLEII